MATTTVDALHFTGDPEADAFLGREPLALLIGFCLDQQVTVQKAFSSPLELSKRIGGLDAARVWTDASDTAELRANLEALPGFGEMKVKALGAVLWKRFGVPAAEELDPGHPTLGDVDSPEALEEYQAKKRAYKAKLRAQA